MPDYLHNHPEFDDLLRAVGQAKGIDPFLVAKDYWIMHVLYALKESGFIFQLKGGTSLSKGYGIIHRFSEDIDIRIEPPAGMAVKSGKNHDKEAHRKSRKRFYDWLAQEIRIDGITEVVRDTAFDDTDFRNGGIRLHYRSSNAPPQGIKTGILLEVGFDKVTPNQPVQIGSWALSFALERNVEVKDNSANAIACYDPRYTFVEKLQTIAKKHGQQQSTGKLPENFIRHYYDVMCLLKRNDVQMFIGTPEYLAHKEERFRGPLRGINLSQAEAFLLRDQAAKDLYVREYEKSRNLYYQDRPSFDEILSSIQAFLPRF